MEMSPPNASAPPDRCRVLLIDHDADIVQLVVAVLTDEDYSVETLSNIDHASLAAAVGMHEPDCVLLDGGPGPEFGDSWAEAAYLAARERSVPTVMFTAHVGDVHEAEEGTSDRAVAADFAAILSKPFDLDELLDAVARACGRAEPFNRSEEGERARTEALLQALRAAGATDVRTSNRREWATFVSSHDGRIYQIYWWQRLGVYIVGRYGEKARLGVLGQFFERDAAIAAALR